MSDVIAGGFSPSDEGRVRENGNAMAAARRHHAALLDMNPAPPYRPASTAFLDPESGAGAVRPRSWYTRRASKFRLAMSPGVADESCRGEVG